MIVWLVITRVQLPDDDRLLTGSNAAMDPGSYTAWKIALIESTIEVNYCYAHYTERHDTDMHLAAYYVNLVSVWV